MPEEPSIDEPPPAVVIEQPVFVDLEAAAFDEIADAVMCGETIDPDTWERVLGWCGRIAAPHLLADAWEGEVITDATLARHVGQVWSGAEFPDQLGHDRWGPMFRAAGFTVDGQPAQLPAVALELWRGSVPERRTDWSWTTDRTIAEEYAAGGFRRPVGRLYRVLAPPPAMLAAYNGRDEAEYVLDTDGLEIVEWPARNQ